MDKPVASRSAAAEIYVLGLKSEAPAKIDPRLFNFEQSVSWINRAIKEGD